MPVGTATGRGSRDGPVHVQGLLQQGPRTPGRGEGGSAADAPTWRSWPPRWAGRSARLRVRRDRPLRHRGAARPSRDARPWRQRWPPRASAASRRSCCSRPRTSTTQSRSACRSGTRRPAGPASPPAVRPGHPPGAGERFKHALLGGRRGRMPRNDGARIFPALRHLQEPHLAHELRLDEGRPFTPARSDRRSAGRGARAAEAHQVVEHAIGEPRST